MELFTGYGLIVIGLLLFIWWANKTKQGKRNMGMWKSRYGNRFVSFPEQSAELKLEYELLKIKEEEK